MIKRQYIIVYTNMLNIFKTVKYIQSYSLYSKKVSPNFININIFNIQYIIQYIQTCRGLYLVKNMSVKIKTIYTLTLTLP